MTRIEHCDLEQRITGLRARLPASGGAGELASLMTELDELLAGMEQRQAVLAAERKWLARSNTALMARLDRLEGSLVFRFLRLFEPREPKGHQAVISNSGSSYR